MKWNYTLKDNRTGKDLPEFATSVEITMTDELLIFDFDCKNSQFFSASNEYNGPLFDGDVCEAFICTSADQNIYYEIEVAPNGQVFLNKVKNNGGGGQTIDLFPIEENFVKTKVEFNGKDYKLQFSVPLDKIGYDEKVGIKCNVLRIETEGGITDKNLLAVSPTLISDFHYPEFFFKLI